MYIKKRRRVDFFLSLSPMWAEGGAGGEVRAQGKCPLKSLLKLNYKLREGVLIPVRLVYGQKSRLFIFLFGMRLRGGGSEL